MTTKILALTDALGNLVRFVLLPGQRIGLIRFGSRCDVYLPEGTAPLALVGQRMVAGETVIADLDGQQVAREGRAD